ncbi:MAG: hypothetical protein NTU44_04500 [Bacteroidetes bacterium]|nr:hypothetical protein [Bacteroidota bacterium]
MEQENHDLADLSLLKQEINKLKERIHRIESRMENAAYPAVKTFSEINSFPQSQNTPGNEAAFTVSQEQGLESKLGEYGLAWMGNIVLLFGFVFLTRYLQNLGYNLFAAFVGYLSAALVFLLAGTTKNSFKYLSFLFNLSGYCLLFYFTLSLHFLTSSPLIPQKEVVLALVVLLIGIQVYLSVKKNSEVLTGLALVFMVITASIFGNANVQLTASVLTASIGMWLFQKNGWWKITIITLVLTYANVLFWYVSNPFSGGKWVVVSEPGLCIYFLGIIAFIYSLITLTRKKDDVPDDAVIATVVLNGLSFSTYLALIVISFYSTNYIAVFSVISLFCLAFSSCLKTKSVWKYSPSFYALYGFVTISVTIYGIYGLPFSFFLLSVQSLLVVSIALWYRSRFIVFMNSMMFLSLWIAYLWTFAPINSINISFSLVALLSARIISWQQARLELKNDLLRNFYLITGYFLVLYTLFHLVPQNYVTVSWTVTAIVYFVLSILIKNVKYRYLALGTIVAAAFYLFLFDLARVEMVFRIIAFLFLAFISIGLSIYYVKKLKKKSEVV